MKIKRFVIVTQDYFPLVGGITTWCHEIGLNLQKRGYEVLVITKGYEGGEEGRENGPLPVLRLDHRRWKNKKYPLIIKALRPFIDAETVFLCANWKMAIACMWHAQFRRVRYLVGVHGLDALEGRLFNRALGRRAMQRSGGIIAVSNYTAGLLESYALPPGKVQVINNGVNAERFRPGDREAAIEKKYALTNSFRLLTVSRLARRKGVDYTIQALAAMNNPGVHYYIAGKGGMAAEWQRLAESLGVAGQVHFLGFVPDEDLPALFRACDLFIMPSRTLPLDVEGFGITYLEAAACGLAAIGGSGSGAEDAIAEGETGLLVNPESPEEIRRALRTCIEHPQRLRDMGRRARARVERAFTWQHVVAQIIRLAEGGTQTEHKPVSAEH